MENSSAKSLLVNEQSHVIPALSLDKDELRQLLAVLQERLVTAAQLDIDGWNNEFIAARTPEELEAAKATIRSGYRIAITLKGTDSRQHYGDVETVFSSPNFPEDVKSVFFDSSLWLKNQNSYTCRNSILLNLDFTRHSVFDFTLSPSAETPNVSNIVVRGIDPTWVNGVFHEFEEFRRRHKSSVAWVHRHTIYDLGIWVAGLPLGFYICSRTAPFISAWFSSPFLRAAAYVYLFVAWLVGCRTMFHYARWIWPKIEYRSPRHRAFAHRAAWATLVGGVLVSVVYDAVKSVFAHT